MDIQPHDTAEEALIVSCSEEMNPSRRCSMEDCTVYAPAGTWGAPDETISYLGVYDGHGGEYRFVPLAKTTLLLTLLLVAVSSS